MVAQMALVVRMTVTEASIVIVTAFVVTVQMMIVGMPKG